MVMAIIETQKIQTILLYKNITIPLESLIIYSDDTGKI